MKNITRNDRYCDGPIIPTNIVKRKQTLTTSKLLDPLSNTQRVSWTLHTTNKRTEAVKGCTIPAKSHGQSKLTPLLWEGRAFRARFSVADAPASFLGTGAMMRMC